MYEWSLKQAAQEAQHGFPLGHLVRGSNAEKYVRFFRQLAPADVFPTSQALVKRVNFQVLLGKKPIFSQKEATCVANYLQFEQIIGPGGSRTLAGPEEPRPVWTVELRKTLRGLIKDRFLTAFGKPESPAKNELTYEAYIGDICITTELDFGGHPSFSYHHQLFIRDDVRVLGNLSLLQWLGAASVTRWRSLKVEEFSDAADAVLLIAQYFVEEMKILFAK